MDETARTRSWPWRRSARCAAENHCVEVAMLHDGRVAVRSSLSPDVHMLVTERSWHHLVAGIKSGTLGPR